MKYVSGASQQDSAAASGLNAQAHTHICDAHTHIASLVTLNSYICDFLCSPGGEAGLRRRVHCGGAERLRLWPSEEENEEDGQWHVRLRPV